MLIVHSIGVTGCVLKLPIKQCKFMASLNTEGKEYFIDLG
jgi:hypothetical protein